MRRVWLLSSFYFNNYVSGLACMHQLIPPGTYYLPLAQVSGNFVHQGLSTSLTTRPHPKGAWLYFLVRGRVLVILWALTYSELTIIYIKPSYTLFGNLTIIWLDQQPFLKLTALIFLQFLLFLTILHTHHPFLSSLPVLHLILFRSKTSFSCII